ncbi:hypothetical protein ACLB2K_013595 [Fragaria x ananassa]
MNNNPDDHLDFRPPTPPPSTTPPPPPPTQPHHHPNVVVSNPIPTPAAFASSSSTSLTIADSNAPQQQRKKRSRLTRPEDADDDNPANKRPKPPKKPNPSAPKITTPCTECGRTFWSWKALFGHMRCHPERHWRGIQPPPDFQRSGSSSSNPVNNLELELSMGEDDHDAASSLLILAGGTDQTQLLPGTSGCRENDTGGCRFECSSCKKVFGSHQALGGHRASHKNVKGCFAITKNDVDVDEEHHHNDGHDQHGNVVVAAGRSYGVEGSNVVESMEENSRMVTAVESGHQCSICWRVFSSGQALGGHKRCHWERGEDASVVMTQFGMSSSTVNSGGLDLNLPPSASASVAPSASASVAPSPPSASAAPAAFASAAAASAPASEDDQCSSYSWPGLGLDLRFFRRFNHVARLSNIYEEQI